MIRFLFFSNTWKYAVKNTQTFYCNTLPKISDIKRLQFFKTICILKKIMTVKVLYRKLQLEISNKYILQNNEKKMVDSWSKHPVMYEALNKFKVVILSGVNFWSSCYCTEKPFIAVLWNRKDVSALGGGLFLFRVQLNYIYSDTQAVRFISW